MQTKLQELTDKIYSEGVEKARSEAEEILSKAKSDAAKIEKEAKQQAESIISEAEKKAESLHKHVESELKMTIKQAVNSLKQDLTTLITLKAVQPDTKKAIGDTEFLKTLIEKIVAGWTKKDSVDLTVILPEKDKEELEAFFRKKLSSELSKGLELEFSDGMKSGFKVGPSNDNYLISFTDQDFIEFFKAYLRPKTAALLFADTK